MESGYIAVFTMGFLGGLGHCTGMCGPIVASYTLSDTTSTTFISRFFVHLLYNTGRITTYMFIGAFMGLTGSFVDAAGSISGFQHLIAVIAGVIMIIMGLNVSGIIGKAGWLEGHNHFIMRAGKELLHEHSLWRYYLLGALFGFLPCGFAYAAFTAAAGTGNLVSGMLLMMFFGLGTLPALLLFGIAASYISIKLRGLLYKTAGVFVIFTGIYFLMRGIRLYASV